MNVNGVSINTTKIIFDMNRIGKIVSIINRTRTVLNNDKIHTAISTAIVSITITIKVINTD